MVFLSFATMIIFISIIILSCNPKKFNIAMLSIVCIIAIVLMPKVFMLIIGIICMWILLDQIADKHNKNK